MRSYELEYLICCNMYEPRICLPSLNSLFLHNMHINGAKNVWNNYEVFSFGLYSRLHHLLWHLSVFMTLSHFLCCCWLKANLPLTSNITLNNMITVFGLTREYIRCTCIFIHVSINWYSSPSAQLILLYCNILHYGI